MDITTQFLSNRRGLPAPALKLQCLKWLLQHAVCTALPNTAAQVSVQGLRCTGVARVPELRMGQNSRDTKVADNQTGKVPTTGSEAMYMIYKLREMNIARHTFTEKFW